MKATVVFISECQNGISVSYKAFCFIQGILGKLSEAGRRTHFIMAIRLQLTEWVQSLCWLDSEVQGAENTIEVDFTCEFCNLRSTKIYLGSARDLLMIYSGSTLSTREPHACLLAVGKVCRWVRSRMRKCAHSNVFQTKRHFRHSSSSIKRKGCIHIPNCSWS